MDLVVVVPKVSTVTQLNRSIVVPKLISVPVEVVSKVSTVPKLSGSPELVLLVFKVNTVHQLSWSTGAEIKVSGRKPCYL
jgi:hypothetical protein